VAQQPDSFRDFGILPEGMPPPPDTIRCFLSRGRVIGQYIGTALVSAVGVGLAVLLAWLMPFPANLLGCAAALAGFAAVLYLATHNDYRWVELDGMIIRAEHFYTGRVIERSVEEIDTLATIVYQTQRLEVVVIEAFFGRVKGIEIRFRDRRTPLRILRADPAMTNAKELIEALLYRMTQIREVDAEVVNWKGKPLVRYIHWKGEKPSVQSGKVLKLSLCCFIFLGLMFGFILGMWGRQEQRRQLLSSVPAQELTLRALIDNGPGTNPHLTLTEFRFGGYVTEKTSDSAASGPWSKVWIVLFPQDDAGRLPGGRPEPGQEVKVVLMSDSIRDEAALRQFVQQHQRVTGICSDTPWLSSGTLRTELTRANPGSRLSAAWVIDDLSDPPSADRVQRILWGSAGCYALVIALALVVFTKTA
jgi:hypothetical protein